MNTKAYQPLNVAALPNVPAELREGIRFVCWREAIRDGKATKIPVNAHTLAEAESDNSATWATFTDAVASYTAHTDTLHGVGRMFHPEDGFIGIDFDKCLDAQGNIFPGTLAAEWLPKLNSYSEVSPSGKGVKVWVRGQQELGGKSGRRDSKRGVEIYKERRFFTITGRRLAQFSSNVEPRQSEVDDFYQAIWGMKKSAVVKPTPCVPSTATDAEIIKRASNARNGDKFRQLWAGDWQTVGFGSQSEADAALCGRLWFWTGDREAVRRLFGQSALGQREKWTARPDYQETTLDVACKGKVYKPRRQRPPAVRGQNGCALLTPSQWFARNFPSLVEKFGDAILEETDKDGVVSARDIGEDFLAATLGSQGCPDSPTVFAETEEKFWTYSPKEGVFILERDPALLTRLSAMLLESARACRGDGCETKTLEFRFRDSANLTGVLKKARGLLAVPHDYFSTNLSEFIPCANGMLRHQDRMLLPFSPSYRRRNKLAVPFDATAVCAFFLDTLMRPALDADELDLLQRWCGLALIGENLAQRLLILDGTAGGGKGTFIRVLSGIIGQVNLASLRTQLLGERFELGRFIGKTLLYGADVPSDFLNQKGASVLKSLTGYDPVTLEFKNSNESPSITCRFNVIVTCNSRLTVRLEGDTDAWRRRLAVIEYRKPKPDKAIADLDQRILATEGSGVLNWMLEGLDKLRADGWQLNLNARQQAIVDNLLLESDGHAVFARECLRGEATQNVTVPDCFAAYVEFCTQRGWTALTKNKFGALIGDVVVRQFGITTRHDIRDADGRSQRGWRGITLAAKSTEPTGGIASEVSEPRVSDESDALFPVHPAKNTPKASELAPVTATEGKKGHAETLEI